MAIFDYDPKAVGMLPYWKWNRVLPAVYDDSLSQYEILCKLLYKVNDIITNSNSMGEQVEQLTQLVQQLIDGEFPSGIVEYVTEIVNAAIADDMEAIQEIVSDMQETLDNYSEQLAHRRINGITPTGVIQALYNCGMSYVGKPLIYKHKAEAANAWNYETGPEIVSDAGGNTGYAINCIAFVNLVMAGVPYDSSMYALGTKHNAFGDAGYCFSAYDDAVTYENYTLYDTTSKLAQRLLDMGLAEYTTSDYSNVHAGDIIFYLETDTEEQLARHCAIVLGGPYCEFDANDNICGMFTTMDAAETTYPIRVHCMTGQMLVNNHVGIVAHIPYGNVIEQPTRLISTVFGPSSDMQFSSEDMGYASGTFTVDFDLIVNNANPDIHVYINGYSAAQGGNPFQACAKLVNATQRGKWIHHTVLMNTRYSSAYDAWAAITSIRITLTNCQMKNVKIYKGIGTIASDIMPILNTNSLTDIQNEILRYAINSEYIRAYQTMHYIIPVHNNESMVIGTETFGAFMYLFECTVTTSTTAFAITVEVTHGTTKVIGRYWNGSWTWA